jgi:peptidoglycan hydrolase CwlO-like protein
MIWAFIKGISPTQWLIGGLVMIIVLMGIAIGFLNIRVDYLKTEAQTLNLKIDNLESEKKMCMASIDRQNLAVEQLAAATTNMQTKMDRVAQSIKTGDSQLQGLLGEIGNKPIPKDCVGALNELVSFSKQYATDWNKK